MAGLSPAGGGVTVSVPLSSVAGRTNLPSTTSEALGGPRSAGMVDVDTATVDEVVVDAGIAVGEEEPVRGFTSNECGEVVEAHADVTSTSANRVAATDVGPNRRRGSYPYRRDYDCSWFPTPEHALARFA